MTSPQPSSDRVAALAEVAESTARLLGTAADLDDTMVGEPSGLPGWTRGHVLTHVARNADGLLNLSRWGRTGVETPMYPGGRASRDAAIEAGSRRPLTDLLADLVASAARLAEELRLPLPPDRVDAVVRVGSGTKVRAGDLPLIRVREVEIHHVDLAAGYTSGSWPEPFAVRTLDQLAPVFRTARDTPVAVLADPAGGRAWTVAASGPRLEAAPGDLLAWLTGRPPSRPLTLADGTPAPPAPTWV